MAINRLVIDGYGQLELNNVAFRRDGRIEAQCALDATDFASVPAENGMLLVVDNVNRVVKLPEATNDLPIALNYSAEHLYDERHYGLKDFALRPGEFLPRLGYLSVGDKFTTNCVCYDSSEFNNEEALGTALAALDTTPLYGTTDTSGAIKITKTKPSAGISLLVIADTDMPDGQRGIKFQVLAA